MPERPMQATGVWLGNSAWPSGSSPGAFARDVFRLERCETDRDRALVFNKWLLRCMNRGPNMRLPGLGGYIHSADPHLLFTSWGHNECTGWGWVATEALQAAGMKARRAVTNDSGHTFYEVWYKGLDGKEGWHAFDPFIGWYFLNEAGEVASCEELAANPDLVTHPRPGGRERLGHHPERSGVLHRYKVGDNLDVVQPVKNYELRYEMRPGMSFSNLWKPQIPELALRYKEGEEGAHCDIAFYDEDGKPRYPEHHPYWKHYVWPTGRSSGISGGEAVRWHGSGTLRWEPLLYGQAMTHSSANAVFENGTLRPTGAKKHCEVWWHIKLPYLASYLRLNVAADCGGGDLIGFAVSPDAGRSLHTLYWERSAPPKLLSFGPDSVPGIKGMQEFWLRCDISTQSATSPLRIRGLGIHVGYQVNMHILPRLVPGANELYLQAEKLEGVKLTADWAYTHPDGEKVERVELAKSGRSARSVEPGIKKPDDLIMRGVTVKCLPA
ncbi:MAG: hypothetical protein HY291_11810 [Planctomycetes bacterium]|nr:hypothetical protein [Planctomycetota bacterium]